VSEGFIERRIMPQEQIDQHLENSRKLDKLLDGQTDFRVIQSAMLVKLDDLAGTVHKPGRMKDLEDRVDKLEDAKTALSTLKWIIVSIGTFLGLDAIKHWFGK
jgi:hypothetical protein